MADEMCCMGAVIRGPEHCTCWVSEFEPKEQAPPRPAPLQVATECCRDCAYRPGSPERSGREGHHTEEDLDDLPLSGVFACHQGMRRRVRRRHPDGRVEQLADDYAPLMHDGVAYLADGRPALLCAGWAARVRAQGWDPVEEAEERGS